MPDNRCVKIKMRQINSTDWGYITIDFLKDCRIVVPEGIVKKINDF